MEDTVDLGSIGFSCASSSLATCIVPLSSNGRTLLFLSGDVGSNPSRGVLRFLGEVA